MPNLWWETHRLLTRGARGPDVEHVQKALNASGYVPPLAPTGHFDSKTEAAVKWFQRLMLLIDDGKVGPVTYSVLVNGEYRWELPRPPWVKQGVPNLCWAACLESVLAGSWPGRPRLTVSDLRKKYQAHLKPKGDIAPQSLRKPIGTDLRFREVHQGKNVRAESILKLLRDRKPTILVDDSTGMLMHARVIYGVTVRKGAIDVLMMDPLSAYTTVPIARIQILKTKGFFAPNEVAP